MASIMTSVCYLAAPVSWNRICSCSPSSSCRKFGITSRWLPGQKSAQSGHGRNDGLGIQGVVKCDVFQVVVGSPNMLASNGRYYETVTLGRIATFRRRKLRWAQLKSNNAFNSNHYAPLCKPVLDPNLSTECQLQCFQNSDFKFWIITASTSEELLAAATLRAQLFYSYPDVTEKQGDSVEIIKERLSFDFQSRDLLKSRIRAEFNRDCKMQLLQMRTKCLLAVCESTVHEKLILATQSESRSVCIPPSLIVSKLGNKTMLAIGTLDLQDGQGTQATVDVSALTFQLFSLANARAQEKNASKGQVSESVENLKATTSGNGYIFNLCVIESVRGKGVATALMEAALKIACTMQLDSLYVHVEANNKSALALYNKLGYLVQGEESDEVELQLNRPRRILLSKDF